MIQKSEQLFLEMERMATVTKEQADMMIQHYLRDQIDAFNVNVHSPMSIISFPMKIDRTKDHVNEYQVNRTDFDFLNEEGDKSIGAGCFKEIVGNHLHGAERNFNAVHDGYMNDNGIVYDNTDFIHNAVSLALRHSLRHLRNYKEDVKPSINTMEIASPPQEVENIIEHSDGNIISAVFSEFINEDKRSGVRESTIKKKGETYNLIISLFGDITINNIGQKEAQQFKKLLLNFPSNRNKKKAYKDYDVIDFLSMDVPENDRIAINTINGHLINAQSFMSWAMSNGYYTQAKNPFEGMIVKSKVKSVELRKPFSDDELKAIFNCPIYQGCFKDNQSGWYKEGDLILKDSPRYWLPLIALYSGARQGEIYNLGVENIKQVEGIYVFDFVEDAEKGKLLKTASSRRQIPIHSKIIDAGFLQFVNDRKNNGHDELFTQPNQANYSKQFRGLLKRLEIKSDRNAFHSFRHNMKDTLDRAGVSDRINCFILGHSEGSSVHHSYGSGHIPMQQLKDAIEKVQYDFIKLH